MKKFRFLLLLCILVMAIAGCSKSDNKDKNKFVFATWAAGTELDEFKQIVERVNNNANGEYTIEILSIPSDYYVKLSTMIAAKNSPDFFWMTQELISKYATLGSISDLTEQFNASDKLKPNDYYEGVLASATYKDKYFGLPWIANPIMVYYNKTLFDKLNIKTPQPTDTWTWSEFIDIARQFSGLTNEKGENLYGYIVDGWPNIETFIWAGGGDIIADDGTTILLDSKETIKGLSYLNTIIKEGLTPKYAEIASLGSNNVWFEKQRVAMYMGGLQDNFEEKISKLDKNAQFEIGYAPLPVCDDGKSWSFDWTASTVMAKSLEGNELAYRALTDLTLEFFSWKVAPPVKSSLDSIVKIAPLKANAMNTIEYTLNNARSAHYVPEWSDINDKLWYNLYVQMLNDANFDYESKAKELAEYSRKLISERK